MWPIEQVLDHTVSFSVLESQEIIPRCLCNREKNDSERKEHGRTGRQNRPVIDCKIDKEKVSTIALALEMSLYVDHCPSATEFRAFLNPLKMEELGVEDGDLVQVATRSKSKFVICMRASASVPSDRVALSRPLRLNLGLFLGDLVKVGKVVKLPAAENVVFAAISDTVNDLDGSLVDILLQSKVNFRGLVARTGLVIPIFALNRVIEFKIVSVKPEGLVVVKTPNVIECKETRIPRDDTPRFDGVCYDDIGGLKIGMIRQAVELKESTTFMVTGPSGCGKTFLANAIRNETNSYFVYMRGMQLFTMDEDLVIGKLEELTETLIENAPSILFFDDFDVAASEQVNDDETIDDRLSNALFAMLQRLKKAERVIVICTMREKVPKRFYMQTCHINIGLPNYEQRLSILKAITRKGILQSDAVLAKIAKSSEKKTASELKRIVERDYFNVILGMEKETGKKVKVCQLELLVVKNNPEEKPPEDEDEAAAQRDLMTFKSRDDLAFVSHGEGEEEEEDQEQRRKSRHRHRHGKSRRRRHYSRRRSRRNYSSESSDQEEDIPRRKKSRKRRESSSEDSSDDEYDAKARKSNQKRRKERVSDEDDRRSPKRLENDSESESDDEERVRKNRRSGFDANRKRKQESEDSDEIQRRKEDSDSEPEYEERPRQQKPLKETKTVRSSEDSDDSSEETSSLYGRKKKPQKTQKFGDPFGSDVKRAGTFPSRKAVADPPRKEKPSKETPARVNPFAKRAPAKGKPKLAVESDYEEDEPPKNPQPQTDSSSSGDDGDIRVSEF